MLPERSLPRSTAHLRIGSGARPISLAVVLIVGGCASVCGCASVSTDHDYDREVSFAAVRTFVWVDAARDSAGADAASDPFLQRRLRRSVEREFLDRGFVAESGAAEADIVVTAYALGAPTGEAGRWSGRRSGPRISFGIGIGFGHPWWYGSWHPGCCGFGYPYFGYPYRGFPYWGFPYWGFPFVGYPVGFWYPWVGVTWGPAPAFEVSEGHAPGTLIVDIWDARTRQLVWRGWSEAALLYAPEPEDLPRFIDQTIGKILARFPPGD